MMIIPRKEDAYHKLQLYRLLSAVIDTEEIASQLGFKGGTCAAMLGYLDRFSVDLDFDLLPGANKKFLLSRFHKLFKILNLEVKDESQKTLLFFLRYEAVEGQRNTIKLDAVDKGAQSNIYSQQFLPDIDRYMTCQTIETMFANKLVALMDRFEKNGSLAGRDLYDIHHFFEKGYEYNAVVIKERTGKDVSVFFQDMVTFVEEKITQRIIDQDLNTLLPNASFHKIRARIKQEVLLLLKDELQRINSIV